MVVAAEKYLSSQPSAATYFSEEHAGDFSHAGSRVRPRTQRRSLNKQRLVLLSLLGTLGLFLVGLGIALVYTYPVHLGYQIVAAEKEIEKMEKENQMLRLEVAKYRSLERVEAVAVGKLKMQRPEDGKVMFASAPLTTNTSSSQTVAAQNKPSNNVMQAAASMLLNSKKAKND